MKIDMSPHAVRQRLETADELWLLSVKLMNAKKVKSTANTPNPDNRGKTLGNRTKKLMYPITAAVRYLREKKVRFIPHFYDYVEKGGTRESTKQLGVDEHAIIKTLVFETNQGKPLVVLMHGDRQVSAKNLARHISVKSVEPATPERATKWTGYLVGGTSPFGTRTQMPVYVEKTIFDLDRIYINGGKRGFLIEIDSHVLKGVLQIHEVEIGIES